MIAFILQPGSGVPTYLQLVQQVEHALRVGQLNVGDQLPRVREVVADLAINPNTVGKAYRELESRGLAQGRPGSGTFVTATLGDIPVQLHNRLRRGLMAWLRTAKAEGLDDSEVMALFVTTLRDLRTEGVA